MNVSGFSSSGRNFKLTVSLAEAFLKTTFSNKIKSILILKLNPDITEQRGIQ